MSVKPTRVLTNNGRALTTCKKFMADCIFHPMPKLNTVLGFRPTDEELEAVVKAEEATGRNRSDILRACFHYAGKAVVQAMKAQRDAAASAFETAMSHGQASAASALQDSPGIPLPSHESHPNPAKPVTYRTRKQRRKVA